MSALVQISTDRGRWLRWGNAIPVSKILPFYKSERGEYVHRIRHATHYRGANNDYHHTGITMWCGSIGSVGGSGIWKSRGGLFANPPERAVFCATCEGRAIGSGQLGAREICGRIVMFKPRI